MVKLGSRWKQAVAVLAVLALAYQAWRSRWLWGLPDGDAEARAVAAVAGDPVGAGLDRYLSRLAAYGYSGSVLVARGGRVLLHKGYGLADRASGKPYTAETLFDIASIAKQFTAAAILKLEMAGKLKVEDTLGRFFPEAPADKAAITLHQLLTHTSGLRDTFGEEYDPVTRQELLRRVFASRLLGPPGRRYRYSNGGYSVLAAVVEVASGETYDHYLRGQLFAPAGMRHTGFRLPARELALVAHGYTADGDWGTPLDHPWAADGPYWDLRGNGGILSTTGDLYRWHLALAGDRVLSRPEREKYIRPYVSEGRWAKTDYGYGWSVGKSPTGKLEVSHIGGNAAFESDFRRYLGDDAVIILSGNSVDVSALMLGDHLENRLFGLPDADPPAVAAPPVDPAVPGAAALAARCAGDYLLPAGAGSAGGDTGARGGGPGEAAERLRVTVDAAPWAPAGRLEVAATGHRGLTLLLGALAAEDRDLVAGRDEDTAAALAAAREGRIEPFAKLMGLEPAAASALLAPQVAALTRRLGAWTGVAALGGAARGGRWASYARCDLARGASIADLGWAGPTAETLRFVDALPGQRFVPEAPGVFAAFDPRTGVTVRADCELPAGGGPAAALVLRSGDGAPVRAVRAGPP
ncbi:MAG TPA: serine hydrolase domain-containing protein [Thermoanaerobaculia bacterium]|jgi:CubicO group peptidase (beta-lactamase class C family)|nr:serine hydrolase domain-containing protein [Thermoanaerobaculia bacterium]